MIDDWISFWGVGYMAGCMPDDWFLLVAVVVVVFVGVYTELY